MAYNKVLLNNNTLIDLTEDTVDAQTLLKGRTAHNKAGVRITGNCTFDADTSNATVVPDDVLDGKTFYGRGAKGTGTMPNNSGFQQDIAQKDTIVTIPKGYHDGSGMIKISAEEQEKLIPNNVVQGVTVLGVEGTRRPADDVTAQEKVIIPDFRQQSVEPDDEYDYLSRVIVTAIPFINNGSYSRDITTKSQEIPIPEGYHDGSGVIKISELEQEKLIASNVVQGVTVLGVEGTRRPADAVTAQEKVVSPFREDIEVFPDMGIDYLSKVTVRAISYSEKENESGGLTVSIGGD